MAVPYVNSQSANSGLSTPCTKVDNDAVMTNFPADSKPSPRLGIGGRLIQTLFFLFFLGMGAVFVVLIAQEAFAGLKTWSWSRTECQIVRSSVREADPRGRKTGDFYLDLEYRYSFHGTAYTCDKYRLRSTAFSDYSKVERLVERYSPGTSAVCFVNASAPNEAVLQRGSLFLPLLIFFPMIFVGIGAIGIYSAWRPTSIRLAPVRPISDRATTKFGQGFAAIFFGIFILIGGILFYVFSVRPLVQILSARSWPTVPCTVISSEVRRHSGNRSDTYSVNILYSYVVNDREFKANRYDFMGGSSSGFSGKQAIVGRYRPGSAAFCYVNPADPTQAVLERGFTPMMWIGLLPLVFMVVGLVGVASTLKNRSSRLGSYGVSQDAFSAGNLGSRAATGLSGSATRETLTLKSNASPLVKFFGCLGIALFWNGIVSVFLVQLLKNWQRGYFEWFLGLFLIPFVVIGLGLIAGVGYFFLAAFNPRPRLRVTPGAVHLGETLRLEWEIDGRVEVLQNLRLRLEGREEATYTRGTKTTTDRNVFSEMVIATVTHPQEIRSGSANIAIPGNLMHSFGSKHNKISWLLKVQGEIARWPDLNEEFALTVLPAALNPTKIE